MPARMPRRLLMLLCLTALAAGPAACGNSDVKQGVDEPAREGLALELDGVDYNVFITRQLNTKITPDKAYFDGPEAAKDETPAKEMLPMIAESMIEALMSVFSVPGSGARLWNSASAISAAAPPPTPLKSATI